MKIRNALKMWKADVVCLQESEETKLEVVNREMM